MLLVTLLYKEVSFNKAVEVADKDGVSFVVKKDRRLARLQ